MSFFHLPSAALRVRRLGLAALLFLGACNAVCGAARRYDAVVYGADDRIEIVRAGMEARAVARSVATLVSAEKEMLCRGDGCTFATTILNEGFRNRLCTDEPFRDQPTLGGCTAFLVAPKLMATAGHCVRTADECRDTIVVFDFDLPRAKDKPFTLEKAAIYRCAKVHQGKDDEKADWSVFELDRAVEGRFPLCLRREGRPALGTKLALIGHLSSLPKKFVGGAEVKKLHDHYFEANLDSLGGASGSPVFDTHSFRVEGIFVRGHDGTGPTSDMRGECARARWCSDESGCKEEGFEDVTYAESISELVPEVPCFEPATPNLKLIPVGTRPIVPPRNDVATTSVVPGTKSVLPGGVLPGAPEDLSRDWEEGEDAEECRPVVNDGGRVERGTCAQPESKKEAPAKNESEEEDGEEEEEEEGE